MQPTGRLTDQPFHVMTKPIGPICNLDCSYCYYLHKEDLYPGRSSWQMTDDCLEAYIRQYIATQPENAQDVVFAWQGGEPTLMGIEFFERAVELQKKHGRHDLKVTNTLQTNGVLIDDDWCRFLRRNNFLVGLSIDGPAEIHDRYRLDRKGNPTHAAVRKAMRAMQKSGVDFNALVVVSRANGDSGKRVYEYLVSSGVRHLQFIPAVERTGIGRHAEGDGSENSVPFKDPASGVSSRSVLPEQLGRFLIEVFDAWKVRDIGRVFVQIFDQALSAWLGIEPSLCVFRRTCGRALAMEHNGDVYSCDHFVEPEYLLGNLNEVPLDQLVNSRRQADFAEAKLASLPDYCRQCEVRFVCNGECPKNRFLLTPDGKPNLNYLCAGYRAFFNHIRPEMDAMADLIRRGTAPALIMKKPPRSGAEDGRR